MEMYGNRGWCSVDKCWQVLINVDVMVHGAWMVIQWSRIPSPGHMRHLQTKSCFGRAWKPHDIFLGHFRTSSYQMLNMNGLWDCQNSQTTNDFYSGVPIAVFHDRWTIDDRFGLLIHWFETRPNKIREFIFIVGLWCPMWMTIPWIWLSKTW